ncbi:hypothetical protein GQ53DRAFT_634452 [Thozetella sp. PMI_491]|nr:hypothetical protein GQ53DRAFT_634452 [Thozetella sp. PMI_491]
MRGALFPVLALGAVVSSQLAPPLSPGPARTLVRPFYRDQHPMMGPSGPGPVLPPSDPAPEGPSPGGPGSVTLLSDVMGRERSMNIFAGLARDIESVSQRLDDSSKNSTVLAPLNSAVESLPRKPWEDPRDYGALGPNAYEGDDGQERAQRNLRRFVEAHILPVSPWRAGERVKSLGDDQAIWWEDRDGTRIIQPGNIEVVSVAGTVANGEVVHVEVLLVMNSQPLHGGAGFDRDRDRDREMEDQRHRDEIARRERERDRDRDRDREEVERQHREPYQPGAPHHSSAGSIPIHQPVASRISNTIHSPGGLLAKHGGSAPSMPLGAPSGPPATFGGPLQHEANRPAQHAGPGPASGPQQHQMFAPISHGPGGPGNSIGASNGSGAIFGGPLQQQQQQQDSARAIQHDGARAMQQMPFGGAGVNPSHPAPSGPAAAAQGQQPILNDALSYLDQVKVQFHEQPDVYNKFLDIMKDFKSQTIDTPGVISRVSELFAGHPNLIQGFNTFLPPGYRIECGLENNPNSIRVTTPSGSTIHSIGGSRTVQPDAIPPPSSGLGQAYLSQRPSNWQAPLHHSIESPEANFSVPAQNGAPPFPGSSQASFEGSSPNQQRAVPAVQGGPPAPHGPVARNAHTPTPAAGHPGLNGNAAQQANLEKRGPVEFNHAISYVNKIKNRFQDKPEIYKQFLEILQTYQREQKPIQDVYSQVTTLFHTAPDLLEDFKQFLPESAASTRSTGPHADEGAAMNPAVSTPQPGHSARDGPKMPPVGNFAPPASASKESKKRPRGPDKGATAPAPTASEPAPSSLRSTLPLTQASKRVKTSQKPLGDGSPVEPTLTPVMPEPLGPVPTSVATQDDILFFDRIKKHINNRTTMSEFMKLLNLFNLDLITKDVVLYKANQFIGGNSDLLASLKAILKYDGEEQEIENRPEPPTGRVSLSNCRGFGPSYRLLPKRERLKPCSGRDELCNSVLNDEWASHPTWASEDSGFVAHRKNGYEEGLHRIEEERHDYDYYIEANQKCIQLLEPIAQQMLTLPANERANFKMPPGLGGQSTSIYKRVLKKIYGPEKGAEVANEMFKNPFSVVPIVMARLKQKDEEWRFTQREWEKVWQSQTETMHIKSLDHMGIQVKNNDKRNLSAKHQVDIIKTKHEEQRRLRMAAKSSVPRHQFSYSFKDQELLLDLLRFMTIFATFGGQHNALERRRIIEFFETFVPRFFDLSDDRVQEKLADIDQDSGDDDEDEALPAELSNGRPRRNGKKGDLLRGVLDPGRNGSRSRAQKEDSAASGSKETTPDVGSANEEEMPDAPEEGASPDASNNRWLPAVPGPIILERNRDGKGEEIVDIDGELKADAPFPRSWYNFYCNQNIFVFFSLLQVLYKRLEAVKNNTESVLAELRREKAYKPAKKLGLIPEESPYFDGEDPESFWPRTVDLIEDYINNDIDEARYQDVLRRYYLKNGWTLYTIQDILKSLCRIGLACNNPDTKGEKTKELVKAYLESRFQDETSFQNEISARKFAEKCVKENDMFVIGWYPATKEATVRWIQKEDTTFYTDDMDRVKQWSYYISSYMRTENTEGVARSRLRKTLLFRNLPADVRDASSDEVEIRKAVAYDEDMTLRICLNSLKLVFEKATGEYFIYDGEGSGSQSDRPYDEDQQAFQKEFRGERLKEKLVLNNRWMKGMSQEEVQKANEDYQKLLKDDDGQAQ